MSTDYSLKITNCQLYTKCQDKVTQSYQNLITVRTIWSFYLLTPSGFIYIRQQDHQGRRLLVTQTVQLMLAEMHLLFVIT